MSKKTYPKHVKVTGGTLRYQRAIPRKLQDLLWHYFLSIEQPIEPPYLTVNDGEGDWSQLDLPDDHPEVEELTKINEFLMGHRWAFQGPVRLLYKHSAFQGGRLYTPPFRTSLIVL